MDKPHPSVTLSVVAPVFNEKDTVEAFVEEVRAQLEALPLESGYEIVLVNDGSTDGTAAVLDELALKHAGQIVVVHFSRNFGIAAAVCAALDHATGDAVIVMDSDMQDDPAVFGAFLAKWREGYQVVYAIRSSRQESAVQRFLFWAFYRLIHSITDAKLPMDAGNFALLDRAVADTISRMPERNRYFSGLRAWVGYRQTGVPVARRERHRGDSRVGLRGLWIQAMNAIFSFSYVPIFAFRAIGLLSLLLSFALMAWVLAQWFLTGEAIGAWATPLISISFFGGINVLGVTLVGEYVARIYDEVRQRPNYIVERISRH
ncbi:MAG: glycosyltransferase family 2 protein [Candidatus Hydrogenedentes bacterium]|nr:glycosyltransferase family 2 protein [Candidatus Hydrogenedentota bacterium]